MSKPLTVTQAMRNLTATAPAEVTVVEQALRPSELLPFLISLTIALAVRALAVWAFLALFFPALGVTYLMVLAGLWALQHATPLDPQKIVNAIARKR